MTPGTELVRDVLFEWRSLCLPMMQFQNQLAAVEMATPLERMGSWKISPIMTQPAGPQVLIERSAIAMRMSKRGFQLTRRRRR